VDPVLSMVERPLDQPEEFDRLTLDTRYKYDLSDDPHPLIGNKRDYST